MQPQSMRMGVGKHGSSYVGSDPGNIAEAEVIDDPRKILSDLGPTDVPVRSRSIDATVNWELNWAKLTSITAYSDISSGPWVLDNDATELAVIHNGRAAVDGADALDGLSSEAETFTQEIILASLGEGQLDWTLGAHYFKGDYLWLTGIDLAFYPIFCEP